MIVKLIGVLGFFFQLISLVFQMVTHFWLFAIERMFSAHEISKYAYVYMVQPLAAPDVPSFCLACFGTNNKFTSEHVLLRWQYILKECQKRNIYVLSFGGDGDSRLLKGM